jgi:hypothetical protein
MAMSIFAVLDIPEPVTFAEQLRERERDIVEQIALSQMDWEKFGTDHVPDLPSSSPLGSEIQERALADLVASEDRALLHRGHEIADLTDHAAMTIVAWVSAQHGAAAGEFRIAPDGVVHGSFESTRPAVAVRS